MLAGIAMSALDGNLVNLALPTLTQELQASPASTIWVVNAFQLTVLCLLLPLAGLGDRLGYRRVYLLGMVIFTLASLGCAWAPSLPWLVEMRSIQGLGAAGVMSVNMALVRQIFPRHLLGRGVALNSVVVAVGSVAGPTVAAALLSVADWRWLFAVNVPIGAVVLWRGLRDLPRQAPRASIRLHPLDLSLNVLTFGLVFLGVDALGTRGGADGAHALPTGIAVALLVAGLVAGAIYVARQLRLDVPLLPLDLLRVPQFALSICTSVSAFCAQTLSQIALPFLLLTQLGRSHWQAGLLIMAWPVATIVIAPVAGRLIGRYPAGVLCALGLALEGVGLASLAWLPAQPSDLDIAWRLLACGLGFGLFQSPNNHAIVSSAPTHRSGGAGGMQSTARLTGQMSGAVAAAVVFSLAPVTGAGPQVALAIAALMTLVAAAFSLSRLGAPVRPAV